MCKALNFVVDVCLYISVYDDTWIIFMFLKQRSVNDWSVISEINKCVNHKLSECVCMHVCVCARVHSNSGVDIE